jgi:membrane protein YqaA with SNARE-associated domain
MPIDQDKIAKLLSNPTIKGKSLENFLREDTRGRIANRLLFIVCLLYIVFLVIGSVLLFFQKIQFRDLLDLILAISILAGFLGSAMNFYFKN